ncbi:MAG: hypothetical protein JST62_09710 [Bacteroidetes bacterium]|nr:hypothetical protein [Bacteroidota bacterium]
MKNIKNIFILSILGISLSATAQVAIGKSALSKIQPANTVTNPSISLEFYDGADNKKGLILPWTSTVANQPTAYNTTTKAGYQGMQGTIENGTIIFDLSDKQVKYRKDGAWSSLTAASFPLSYRDTSNATVTVNSTADFLVVDSSLQDNAKENATAKAVIGANANTDTTNGILVLSDNNRAMVLPKVASPHLNIKNPTPGMMAYDTVKRQLAVYNGTIWSFWKP